jgi:hypothetical protein
MTLLLRAKAGKLPGCWKLFNSFDFPPGRDKKTRPPGSGPAWRVLKCPATGRRGSASATVGIIWLATIPAQVRPERRIFYTIKLQMSRKFMDIFNYILIFEMPYGYK